MRRRNSFHLDRKRGSRISSSLLLFTLLALSSTRIAAIGGANSVAAASSSDPQTGTNATVLEPSKALERELNAGEKHDYQVMLVKGQYARIMIEQRGINVIVRASAPDGKAITVVDSELGIQGFEKAELVALSDGPYLIRVEASTGPTSGRYLIQIEELRTATEKDSLAQEARQLDLEANRLVGADKGAEALEMAQRSLAAHEGAFGPDGLETATALHTLAFIWYDYKLDFSRAEMFHRRALAIREKLLGPNHARVASSLIRLSDLYATKGDYATAIPLYERALEIRERILGSNSP